MLAVEINNLEEFMDSIFEDEEIPREFAESMKKKIRAIKFSKQVDNFKEKDNQDGLNANSFVCNSVNHYFFFIAEKTEENKMDISYKFFVGKASILKAFKICNGKKRIVDQNYKAKLEEVMNNPFLQ